MLKTYIIASALIGANEARAQYRELTKDGASGKSAIANAFIFGTFAAVAWPASGIVFACARFAPMHTNQ